MRRNEGFTLIELLIASAIALIILGIVGQTTINVMRINARENQNIPVQQQLRASIEVISQEIRDSVGPRVMYPAINGVGFTLPSALTMSTNNSITLFIPVPKSTFIITPPATYPSTAILPARSATTVQNPSLTDTAATSIDCATAFTGNPYAVLYGTQQTNFISGAIRNPDAFRVMQTGGCSNYGGTASINHSSTPLPAVNWNPNSYIVEVTPVIYNVVNNTLYRTIVGQPPQVVSYNISNLDLSYLPENPISLVPNCSSATFQPAAGCAPRQIRVSLTSTPQNSGIVGSANLTASQLVFLR